MRKAMVLGTNAGQADLIRHLKSQGWHVIGCSGRTGEPGQTLCDVFEHVDIRDVDAVCDLAALHQVQMVYSISSDLAMRSVVKVAERLDLPHYYDSAFIDLLDNKAALRAFLDDHDLSPVAYRQVSSFDELGPWDVFPCVVKPTDGQGQRGVQKIADADGLRAAVDRAVSLSPTGTAIVEQFLDGVEMSCNVFVDGGRARVRVLSERLVHTDLGMGIPSGHLVPAKNVGADAQAAALDLVTRTVDALGQARGVLYFQMINTTDGPRIVEIAPRLDGCHMWRIIKAATGIDFVKLAVDGLNGAPMTDAIPSETPDGDYELMFQQMPPDTAFDAADFPIPDDAIHHEYRYRPGEQIHAVNGTLEVVGYYVRRRA